jgi:hypothetical protein
MPELWPAAVRTIVSYTGFGAFCSVNAVMPTPPSKHAKLTRIPGKRDPLASFDTSLYQHHECGAAI